MYTATFYGLNKWFSHLFEKFGWMILAKAKANDVSSSSSDKTDSNLKLKNYGNQLSHLMRDLREANYVDPDKRKDIEMMIMKLQILINYYNVDFTVSSFDSMTGGAKKKTSKKGSKKSTKK